MLLPPVLGNRDFRVYLSGAVLSAIGTQFTTLALAWQVYQLTNSALQVGLLGLSRAVPQITMTLFGGMLADALDRRRLLIALQIGNLSISATLAILTIAGTISVQALLAAALLLSFSSAVEMPTRQAVVPNLVPTAHLRGAIALNTSQRSISMIVGPSLAGIALAFSGPGLCYSIDALSWFAMLTALLMIRRPLQGATMTRASFEGLLAGVRFVRGQPVILAFMILDFGATFFGSSTALLPIYARDYFAAGPVALGILYASTSVGAIFAAAALSARVHVDQAGRWVLIGVTAYAACTIGFAVSSMLWLSVLMLAGAGAGNMVSAVLRSTTNQLLTPDHLRGRVAAVNTAFVSGGPELGQFESGVVAAWGGAPLSALTGGLGALALVGVIALLPAVRHFRLSDAQASSVPA